MALVEVTTVSRLATETLLETLDSRGTSRRTLNTPTASASIRKNQSAKSTAGATKTTTVTAIATAHARTAMPTRMATERGTTIVVTVSATRKRTATTVSRVRQRSQLVVSVQPRRYLASTERKERKKSASASARRERNKSGCVSVSTKDLANTNVAMMTAGSVRLWSQRRGDAEEVRMMMSLQSIANEIHTSTQTVD
jgi:hypothetical protein